MSRELGLVPKSEFSEDDAQQFMGLMMASQSTDHECPWCEYFREMSKKMLKTTKIPSKYLRTSKRRR